MMVTQSLPFQAGVGKPSSILGQILVPLAEIFGLQRQELLLLMPQHVIASHASRGYSSSCMWDNLGYSLGLFMNTKPNGGSGASRSLF